MANSFWFYHDYAASEDVKILFLRQQLGMEGVGIYWYILERLAQAGGKLPLKIIPVLSMNMHTSEAKTSAVIQNFELFEVDKDLFFSQRLIRSIEEFNSSRARMSEGGKRAAAVRWGKDKNQNGMIL